MLNVLIILNFFARDNHELGRSGRLKQILTRTFDGVVVTEMLKLLGGDHDRISSLDDSPRVAFGIFTGAHRGEAF